MDTPKLSATTAPESTKETSNDFFVDLPKAELHAHLNGSIPINILIDLIKETVSTNPDSPLKPYTSDLYTKGDGFLVSLPSPEISAGQSLELKRMILHKCFDIFKIIHSIIVSKSALFRITQEVIKSFYKDGVRYLELRTTPKSIPDSDVDSRSVYISTILEATSAISKTCPGMIVRYLLSINREKHTVADADEIVQLAIKFKKDTASKTPGGFIVGIDVSGNPTKNDNIQRFHKSLSTAQKAGLGLSIHFAEIYDPVESEWILTTLQPDRLGHGNFLDDNLEKIMFKKPISLEVCCTSNVLTASVRSPKHHHFNHFYKAGYPVIICTDDCGIFNSKLSEEYHLLCNDTLSKAEITQLASKSFSHGFAFQSKFQKCLNDDQLQLWNLWRDEMAKIFNI